MHDLVVSGTGTTKILNADYSWVGKGCVDIGAHAPTFTGHSGQMSSSAIHLEKVSLLSAPGTLF